MLLQSVALSLIAAVPFAQMPATTPARQSASVTITVPPGTLVALKLISTIKSKSTKPGDPVRAIVAFPLAIGTDVAIPAGTYVEGAVVKVNAHPSRGNSPSVQIRFNRLLFANGYSAPLVANNTQASIQPANSLNRQPDALADARDGAPYLGEAFLAGQSNPQLPPLPSNGPSPAALAGIGIGAGVGLVVLSLALTHHHASNANYVLFDSGWQFQMVIEEPLTLDTAQVSSAAAIAH
jgi:hypothetical protein